MGFFDFLRQFISSNKKNAQIIADDFNKIYKESKALEVALYDNKEPLTDKEILIEINNKIYTRTTDQNGIAKININLPVGKYKALFTFKGDDEYKSSKSNIEIYVNPIIETNDLNMSEKDGSSFIVTLKDNNNEILPNTKVTFDVNGKLYERTTDDSGQVSLKINLPQGQYIIKTIKNNIIKTNTINITAPNIVPIKSDKHFGYWVFGRDMYNVDLNSFKDNNVTDIFLNYYAFNVYGDEQVSNWVKDAKNKGMNVHIWMQSFYDGEWRNPVDIDLSSKVEEARKYANINGVYGVHLDYLRYPGNAYKTNGGADGITNFAQQVRDAIPNTFLSCAVMPENDTKYYYGQDIDALGKICNAIIPMQYKGNYEAGTSWLASTTKEFSNKATIWSGLQSYKSDDDTTVLSVEELSNDMNTCLNNGAKGVILFRYGLSPNINFPIPQNTNTTNISNHNKIATRMEGTNVNMTYKDGTYYQCAVYDEVNKRVHGTVIINVNGVDYARSSDNEGLYKLNLNLNPGTYTITSNYNGDESHLPSNIQNTLFINEAPRQEENHSESYELHDYFTNQGGGYLGQKNSYSCGPHSLVQCFHRLTGEDVSEETLMSVCGTTEAGTDHDGINTGVAWFNRTYGYDIKIEWMSFSDLGNNADERFAKVQDMINNGAMFFHLLYRDQWGHYEVAQATWDDPLTILNSLGDYCDYPAYCGYIESRDRASQLSYISGISQPSVAFLHR